MPHHRKPLQVGELAGVARPTVALRTKIGAMYGKDALLPGTNLPIAKVMQDEMAVSALSKVITEAIEEITTKNKGVLNSEELAIAILQKIHGRQ